MKANLLQRSVVLFDEDGDTRLDPITDATYCSSAAKYLRFFVRRVPEQREERMLYQLPRLLVYHVGGLPSRRRRTDVAAWSSEVVRRGRRGRRRWRCRPDVTVLSLVRRPRCPTVGRRCAADAGRLIWIGGGQVIRRSVSHHKIVWRRRRDVVWASRWMVVVGLDRDDGAELGRRGRPVNECVGRHLILAAPSASSHLTRFRYLNECQQSNNDTVMVRRSDGRDDDRNSSKAATQRRQAA